MADNLVLPKGKLYFDPMTAGTTTKTGERFLGNCPGFTLTTSNEKLDHFSSTGGIRTKDKTVILQIDRTGTLTTDNISAENLALFFVGTQSTVTAVSTPVTGEAVNDVIKGRFYQLGVSGSFPAGVRDISAVTVKKGVTTLVAGTDYAVDLTLARLEILTGSVTISNGDDLTVDYTLDASSRSQIVSSSTAAGTKGALRYVADNPEGTNRDFYMPYVELTPNGDYSMIGEEWQTMEFSIEVLKLNDSTAQVYIDGRPA